MTTTTNFCRPKDPYTWTVDVENDWGGRADTDCGNLSIMRILDLFASYNIKALFFISTSISALGWLPRLLLDEGHELGSHGHFHVQYRDRAAAIKDLLHSETLLQKAVEGRQSVFQYRPPKFNLLMYDYGFYASPGNGPHVGLLKYMHFGGKLPEKPIFYFHPFDLIELGSPPNLFCRLWYSRPEKAWRTLIDLVGRYPGNKRLR